jgi:hypothetical protein
MKSVVSLRIWIAEQLGQLDGNNDVEYVLRYIRRNTDHPCYTDDPVLLPKWQEFLKTIDVRKIVCDKK